MYQKKYISNSIIRTSFGLKDYILIIGPGGDERKVLSIHFKSKVKNVLLSLSRRAKEKD
jgi:hypothetical protein